MSHALLEHESLKASISEVVLDASTIAARVAEIGRLIERDYAKCDSELVLVAVLTGASIFAADLMRAVSLPVSLDFVALSRYSPGQAKSEVRLVRDVSHDLKGKHVLVLEDIVDTGLSLNFLLEILASKGPASLHACTLLNRPSLRLAECPIRYSGFEVGDEFLIGYGLDYQGRHRNLPFVASVQFD